MLDGLTDTKTAVGSPARASCDGPAPAGKEPGGHIPD